MKEQVEGLTIQAQTPYALYRGTVMPDGNAVLEKESVEEEESQQAEKERLQREAKERLAREKAAKASAKKGQASREVEKAEKEEELVDPITQQPVEIKSVGDLKKFATTLEGELGRNPKENPFRNLETEDLKNYYLTAARVSARLESKGAFGEREEVPEYLRTYNQLLMEEMEQRDVDLRALFYQAVEKASQEGTPVRSIGAASITETPTDPVLQNIVTEINEEIERVGEGNPLPAEFIAEQLEIVRRRRDERPTASFEAQRLIRTLNSFRAEATEAQRAQRQEERQEEQERYVRGGEPRVFSLDHDEAGEFKIDAYTNPRIREIAQRVNNAINALPTVPDSEKATNEFFRNRINELEGVIAGDTTGEQEIARQGRSLRSAVQTLKDRLTAKEATDRLERRPGLYGEIRMSPAQQRELVQLVIDGNDREIERRFNHLFARADINSSDDWRDALGPGGSLEIDEFMTTLEYAATGRTLPLGKPVEPEQRKKIEDKVRELKQEAKLREYLHSISYLVNRNFGTEDVTKQASYFVVEEADAAYNKRGVVEISHFYEQAMLHVMAKNGGYLPYEAMVNKRDGTFGEVETLVRKQVEDARKMGALPDDLEDWEVNRAISLARGMGIVTGRSIEIVATSGIPKGAPLVSWWANDIVKNIAYFRQVARYDVGKERNKILAYKLEGGSSIWSSKELSEIGALNSAKVLDRFVNESADDRYVDMINPFQIGSIFTKTGWRYRDEKVNHASAIARLLENNQFNPLLGLGMWIEKERGNLSNPEERDNPLSLSDQDKKDFVKAFGPGADRVRTVGEKAELIIRKNLALAMKINPLKLFYNRNGLRQSILREYYQNQIREDKKGAPGQIIITSEELQGDLDTLGVLQEKLMRKRSDAYKAYYRGQAEGAEPPNLYKEYTDLDAEIDAEVQKGTLDRAKAGRIKRFAKIVRDEFAKPNHIDKFMRDLRDKGWKQPFIFGTDDLPYDLYSFTATGGSSFKRRWGDIQSVAQGAEAYTNMIRTMANFRDQETIIKALQDIYNGISGSDESIAREVMQRTIEGIVKFYKKDWVTRLPAGIGTLTGVVSGKASYAQIAGGREQMAWDEVDIDDFLKRAHAALLFDQEQENEVRERTGARKWQLGWAIIRTAAPLSILALIYYLFSKELEDIQKAA